MALAANNSATRFVDDSFIVLAHAAALS